MKKRLFRGFTLIELRIPPLRHRREDIPLLAEHFLARFGAELGRRVTLTPEAMRVLEAYDFPGNVRELENVIERAVALSHGPTIGTDDLPTGKPKPATVDVGAFPPEGVNLDTLVSEFERGWVLRALDHTGGVRKRAASALGISFRSLRYRLQKLGIDSDADTDEQVSDGKAK